MLCLLIHLIIVIKFSVCFLSPLELPDVVVDTVGPPNRDSI